MNKFLFIFLFFSFIGCRQKQETQEKNDIEHFIWLEGNWEYLSENGIYHENWINVSANLMSAKGYFVSKTNDTLYSQKMKLIQEDEIIFLILNAKNFNEERDVKYKLLKTNSSNEFYFENLFKDYPSTIKYKINNDSVCTVLMQGKYKGKIKSESFHLTRIKT